MNLPNHFHRRKSIAELAKLEGHQDLFAQILSKLTIEVDIKTILFLN